MPSSVTLRPNVQITSELGFGDDWTYSGAGFDDGSPALADNSDSTNWFQGSPSDINPAEFGFTTSSLPAEANIVSVTVRVRWHAGAALTTDISDRVSGGSSRVVGTLTGTGFNQPNTNTQAMTTQTTQPSGAAWTQSDIDNLQVRMQKTSGQAVSIMELYADVAYSSPPSATVTAPTGSIVGTNQPTVAWTYADPDGDSQAQYHVKVFTESDYNGGGFDPDSTTPVWDSGATASASTSVQVGSALTADITMKAYVRVADSPSGFGEWASGPEFVVLAAGLDKPGRVFFALSGGPGSDGAGFWEFDDNNREGSFSFKTAPLRDPSGRQVEIREVQVYVRTYDGNAEVTVTVNGVARTETIAVPSRQQLSFRFRERGETLDVKVESSAGNPELFEAPSIEALRIGWRPGHQLL